jgi:hypothetical protein
MAPSSGQGDHAPPSPHFRDTRLRRTFEGAEQSETLKTEAPMPASSPTEPGQVQRPDFFVERRQQSAGDSMRPSSPSLSSGLKETAQSATDALRQQASELAQDVGHELNKTGEDQKMRGADAIRHVARAIDSAASELESQSPTVARTVHETARQVEGLSDNLSGRSVNELIQSATELARARPALFIGGSVVAGFALARFLMSSSSHRSSAGSDSYQS